MKYIIELEEIKGTDLFRVKGFNTLVFDSVGISRLQALNDISEELQDGDLISTPNGTTVYMYKGRSNDGHINAINTSNGKYVSLSADKYRVVERKADAITIGIVGRVLMRVEKELKAYGFISTTHAQGVYDKISEKVASEFVR